MNEEEQITGRGGAGRGQGRKPKEPGEHYRTREKISTQLAPGIQELALKIKDKRNLSGWGHALDEAIIFYAFFLGLIKLGNLYFLLDQEETIKEILELKKEVFSDIILID